MPGREASPPSYSVGPLLAWLGILTTGLVGLVLLSTAFTTGAFPGGIFLGGNPSWHAFGLVLAFALPAVLVLGAGVAVSRLRWKETDRRATWSRPSPSTPGSETLQ